MKRIMVIYKEPLNDKKFLRIPPTEKAFRKRLGGAYEQQYVVGLESMDIMMLILEKGTSRRLNFQLQSKELIYGPVIFFKRGALGAETSLGEKEIIAVEEFLKTNKFDFDDYVSKMLRALSEYLKD